MLAQVTREKMESVERRSKEANVKIGILTVLLQHLKGEPRRLSDLRAEIPEAVIYGG